MIAQRLCIATFLRKAEEIRDDMGRRDHVFPSEEQFPLDEEAAAAATASIAAALSSYKYQDVDQGEGEGEGEGEGGEKHSSGDK
jgi:hypothetical protein